MSRFGSAIVLLAVLAAFASCGSPSAPTPPCTSNCGGEPPIGGGSGVMVGAGDIAVCGTPGAIKTGDLMDSIEGTVFTAGDNAYFGGSMEDYRDCYQPAWGRHKDRTRPVPGNHEYQNDPQAHGYFNYFGDLATAGGPGQGYYTYNVGPWKVLALNSEPAVGVGLGSAQYAWLRDQLINHAAACTVAIWHRPLFTSGPNGANIDMRDFYRLLYDNNAELVINGHDHLYERFGPQDADGRRDEARGLREFIVGTGGVPLYEFVGVRPNSERQIRSHGVLKLTLSAGRYVWDFIAVDGAFSDSGSGTCH